ncbi:BglG family transcription antiterminator [uncultured Brachyspira sp.]|uniref:BglG family transcription antiterminator n=1 Tax=uncultured Brachyspira sp. TaxID=221953 RepID=UPI0026145408|nr:BglG family transcription antiterminator [uncultured Brachyspira sp.]
MKSKYVKEILSILSANSYITAERLAKELNVSEKTIRIKIHELNNEFEKTGIKIVSKPRYGYILLCDDNKDIKAINFNSNMVNDFEYRVKYIFEYLINNDEYIKSDTLSEALDISKTTLTNTLKLIEDNIKYYNIKIERRPNYGIKLIGTEFDIRNCIIDYYLKQQIDDEIYKNKLVENVIINFIKDNDIKLSEINLENFIQYISVSAERIKNNRVINSYNEDVLKDIKDEELELAKKLAAILEKEICIKFNDTEVIFVAIHIASKSLLISSDNPNFIIQNKLDNIVHEMLDLVFNNLKIDLRNNLNLRLLLNHHMIPFDIRIRYNVLQKNPMLCDIKSNYGLAYLIASEANTVLKSYYKKEIPDDEIGYLALLFQIALEENNDHKSKINILIVCGSGKTTSKLLMYKYKKEFGEYIDNIYTTDLIMLKDFDFSKINYIFSTVPIAFKVPVPIVQIGLFLETNDIINVKNALELSKNDFLHDYYNEDLFSLNIQGNTRDEIIKNICIDIKKYIDIPDNFYDSVMKREYLSETDFGNLVAIPHPFDILTDKTFVYVAVLDKPIVWYKNNVQVVFLISISNNKDDNLKKFYQYTVDFLLNENTVMKLIENKTFDNLMYLLKNNNSEGVVL